MLIDLFIKSYSVLAFFAPSFMLEYLYEIKDTDVVMSNSASFRKPYKTHKVVDSEDEGDEDEDEQLEEKAIEGLSDSGHEKNRDVDRANSSADDGDEEEGDDEEEEEMEEEELEEAEDPHQPHLPEGVLMSFPLWSVVDRCVANGGHVLLLASCPLSGSHWPERRKCLDCFVSSTDLNFSLLGHVIGIFTLILYLIPILSGQRRETDIVRTFCLSRFYYPVYVSHELRGRDVCGGAMRALPWVLRQPTLHHRVCGL